jgi:fibronectin-binding autotransporter adhesin
VADNGAFDISGTSGATIKSLSGNSSGTVTLGSNTLTLSSASDTFAGAINGNGGLTLTAGTETLSGANTYSGATTINGGTLKLSGTGSIAASSGVTADGSFDVSGVTSPSGATIQSLSGSGTVALGSQELTLSMATGTFSGGISGGIAAGLVVSGGTQTLAGTNSYNGTTTIESSAALVLQGSGSVESSVTVDGVLTGTGSIKGTNHDLTNYGTVQPGNPTGTFAVGRNYIQEAGGALDIGIAGTPASALFGTLSAANTVTLDLGSILEVNLLNGYSFRLGISNPYDILNFKSNGLNGSFTAMDFDGNACAADGLNEWLCNYNQVVVTETFGSTSLDLTFNYTPEPGTLAILAAGLAGLGWTRSRYRRA